MIDDRLKKTSTSHTFFLNKRGYAGFISCRSCGKVFKCPHCDISLYTSYKSLWQRIGLSLLWIQTA